MSRARSLAACMVGIGALTMAPSDANAAPCRGPGPLNAISIRPLALASHGFAAQYERFLAPRWVSVAVGPEFRWGAHGDYDAFTIGGGIEGRVWLLGRSIFGCVGERAMVGPFAGLRFDASSTRLTDATEDRLVGSSVTFTETALAGFRAHVAFVEVTPTLGMALVEDAGAGLSPMVRPTLTFGLTTGVMF